MRRNAKYNSCCKCKDNINISGKKIDPISYWWRNKIKTDGMWPENADEPTKNKNTKLTNNKNVIKLNDLAKKNRLFSKKFKKACAELGVEPIITNMHFKNKDGIRLSTLETFNQISGILGD